MEPGFTGVLARGSPNLDMRGQGTPREHEGEGRENLKPSWRR